MACSKCSSCPPCEPELPITCEPLEQSPTIQRLVGEDSAACKVTLINPLVQGLLYLDEEGEIGWRTGAADSPINLSDLQTAGSDFTSLAVIEPDGDLAYSKPTYVSTEKWFVIAQNDSMAWVEEKNIFGAGSGFLRKDILSPFGFSWVTGTTGQIATIDSGGNPVFRDAGIVVPANAYPDRIGYQASKSGAKTISINFSNFIVLDSTGQNAIGVFNAALKTLTLTTNGLNGLDAGSLTNSTNYYIFIIHNPTSGITGVLASLSGTTPTMPADFTYKRRVGMFRTDASSNIPDGYNQVGTTVKFGGGADIVIYTKVGGATNGFASGAVVGYISTDFANTAIIQSNQVDVSSSGELNVFIADAAGDSLPVTTNIYGGSAVTSSQNNKHYGLNFHAIMPIGVTSYYNVFYSGMSAGTDTVFVRLVGYILNV